MRCSFCEPLALQTLWDLTRKESLPADSLLSTSCLISRSSGIRREWLRSMSVIQGLDKTEIKIALNCRKGSLGDAIWLMTGLDVLMVQAGPAWEFPDPASL
jgi:hypothetical protein